VSTVGASPIGAPVDRPAQSQLRRVTVAGTSLSTSRIGLGTHALHRLVSRRARQSLLAGAYERGLRYFDSAPSYGAGIAELELGRFAAGRRSELVLTTKFGITAGRMAAAVPGWVYAQMALRVLASATGTKRFLSRAPSRDFSAVQARASVDSSLRRLRTDHVDVLYLHEPRLELLGDPEPLVRALEALKAAGKVRYFGLSGDGVECGRIAAAHPALAEVLQTEVARAADGLPLPASPQRAAVRFWEWGARLPRGQLAQTIQRLREVESGCVLVLSTNAADGLQEVVDSM
jgi:aryl-alcohol dehydrogenase-like predicted oxidoreductase